MPPDIPDHSAGSDVLVTVGRIKGAWGAHGALLVQPITGTPEHFEPGSELSLDGVPVTIRYARWHRGDVVVQLSSVETRPQAEALRDKELQVPASTLAPLPEGEYYHYQLLDMQVWTIEGELLGRVAEILVTGSNDVLVVQGESGEVLIPAIEDVLREVDVARKRMTVELLPGLR